MPRPAALATLVCTLAAIWCPAAAAAEPSLPADRFVDSVGVNVHMTYGDTAYRDRSRLADKLSQAGIRHVRDGLSYNTQYAYDTFNQLAARGIRTTFIMGDPTEQRDTLDQLVTTLRTKVPAAAEAAEGPNEYSYSGDPQWVANLRDYQTRMFNRLKQDPALAHLPVLAPSLITWQDHALLGDLRSALDFGNKHSYPGGDIPESNVDSELRDAARVSGDRPVYVTESGYHNALNTDSGHRPTSEEATATYLPRMFLEYFRRGIPRTFAYELIDEWADPAKRNAEANFGLLRNDYSEKPAFTALSNLIAVLGDSGPAFSTTPLDYSVAGAPSDLRQLVLQKRDGSHYLVLWRATRVWDPIARKAVIPDTRNISVSLPGADGTTKVIAPVSGLAPTASVPAGSAVPLALRGDPVILKVPASSRAGSPPPVAPSPSKPPAAAAPQPAAAPASGGKPGVRLPSPVAAWDGQSVVVPARQTARSVLGRGLQIRCRSTVRASCRATIHGQGSKVIATRSSLLGAGRVVTMRLRLSAAGRSFVRRTLRRRAQVALKVRARVGASSLVTRRVSVVRR